jgi:hypothetical protein
MMKYGLRLALLAAVLLTLPLAVTRARQDDVSLPGRALYQTATSGTFTDNGDDTYTLKLEDVAPNTVFVSAVPSLGIMQIDTEAFAKSWQAGGADLTAQAVIELDKVTIFATLSEPVMDGQSLTYQATIDNILPVGAQSGDTDLEAPEAFKTANLLISGDDNLIKALESGAVQASLTSGTQGNLTTGTQGNLTTGTGGASAGPAISYYQTAAGGTFTAESDKSYILKLTDVYPITMSAAITSPMGVIWVSTDQFAKAWTNGKAQVTAQAVLALDKLRVEMTLSMPESDPTAHTLTYRAAVNAVSTIDTANKDQPPLPTKFDTADLLIGGNTALASALTLGVEKAGANLTSGTQGNLTTGVNDTSECQAAKKTLADYLDDAVASDTLLTPEQYAELGKLNAEAGQACPVSSILLTPASRRSPAPASSGSTPLPPRRSLRQG